MIIDISKDAREMGAKAAKFVSGKLNNAIKTNGEARMVVSTGASQFELFNCLIKEEIDWGKTEVFHLDEYIGLPAEHPASFRKYLNDRFIRFVNVKMFHSIDVEGDIDIKIAELSASLRKKPIDIGLIGIGVNGHIAFNDPPADFNSREAYFVVSLDNQCKMQQVNEGWFPSPEAVPARAVSMTPWQITQCGTIVSFVPYKVKANAVKNTLTSEVVETVPATLLKRHIDFHMYIDADSASEIIPF